MELPLGYRELAPPAVVAEAVACRWTRLTPSGAGPTRVLPDGCIDVIWQAGVGTHVAGPDTGPHVIGHEVGTALVGIRFRPGAGGAALGVPLYQLRDQRVDLADLHPAVARGLHGRLSPNEARARLDAATADLVGARPADGLAREAAARLAAPRVDVDQVARDLAISPRQLRRRCHDAVGYGPKTLHRVLRLRGWLRRLAADSGADLAGLAGLATESGFADQAHLTRECVQLTGLTPAAHARRLTSPGADR